MTWNTLPATWPGAVRQYGCGVRDASEFLPPWTPASTSVSQDFEALAIAGVFKEWALACADFPVSSGGVEVSAIKYGAASMSIGLAAEAVVSCAIPTIMIARRSVVRRKENIRTIACNVHVAP